MTRHLIRDPHGAITIDGGMLCADLSGRYHLGNAPDTAHSVVITDCVVTGRQLEPGEVPPEPDDVSLEGDDLDERTARVFVDSMEDAAPAHRDAYLRWLEEIREADNAPPATDRADARKNLPPVFAVFRLDDDLREGGIAGPSRDLSSMVTYFLHELPSARLNGYDIRLKRLDENETVIAHFACEFRQIFVTVEGHDAAIEDDGLMAFVLRSYGPPTPAAQTLEPSPAAVFLRALLVDGHFPWCHLANLDSIASHARSACAEGVSLLKTLEKAP